MSQETVKFLIQSRRDSETIAGNIKYRVRHIERCLKDSRNVIEQYQISGEVALVHDAIDNLLFQVQKLLDDNAEMQVFVNNTVAELQKLLPNNSDNNTSGSG